MVLDLECRQEVVENFQLEEGRKVDEDFRLKQIMKKLESLKKNSHFEIVLRNKVISNDLFSIYRAKNFIKRNLNDKKLYISFVMRKKTGNAVKRNRIKRKLKSSVQKLSKIDSAIDSDYTYIIFGKEKVYSEQSENLFKKMKKSFKEIKV